MSKPLPYEKAFERLESILEKMNSGEVTLDESLKLYEEADTLIKACNQQLVDAEKKIEILTKNRDGTLALDEKGEPLAEDFNPSRENPLF